MKRLLIYRLAWAFSMASAIFFAGQIDRVAMLLQVSISVVYGTCAVASYLGSRRASWICRAGELLCILIFIPTLAFFGVVLARDKSVVAGTAEIIVLLLVLGLVTSLTIVAPALLRRLSKRLAVTGLSEPGVERAS